MKFIPRSAQKTKLAAMSPAAPRRAAGLNMRGLFVKGSVYSSDGENGVDIVKNSGGLFAAKKNGVLGTPTIGSPDWEIIGMRGTPGRSFTKSDLQATVTTECAKLSKQLAAEYIEQAEISMGLALHEATLAAP